MFFFFFPGCDILMKERARRPGEMPGALWHIFHPEDTVKIRHMLNRIAREKGKRLDPHDDPIHDQSTYLDGSLRMRLYQEYGVQGNASLNFWRKKRKNHWADIKRNDGGKMREI